MTGCCLLAYNDDGNYGTTMTILPMTRDRNSKNAWTVRCYVILAQQQSTYGMPMPTTTTTTSNEMTTTTTTTTTTRTIITSNLF
jgi:hypothetical protein